MRAPTVRPGVPTRDWLSRRVIPTAGRVYEVRDSSDRLVPLEIPSLGAFKRSGAGTQISGCQIPPDLDSNKLLLAR